MKVLRGFRRTTRIRPGAPEVNKDNKKKANKKRSISGSTVVRVALGERWWRIGPSEPQEHALSEPYAIKL